jgi:spermidine/putrescine transport system ATP-binding protein
MTYAVELTRVTKAFGNKFTAVDDVSLQIHEGEFFSLLGPSGCGKTTTLRMIAGFELPTSGDVRIKGQSVGDMPAFKRPVNTVFQNYALFPHMTVFQNVAFGLEMQKVRKADIDRRVNDMLELVRMTEHAQKRPNQLSGGQQQRVALARALVNRPAVLLLDEPLGALDLKLRKQMQLELKQMQMQVGITFVYVTHDQEEALTMSDRIAVMNRGKVVQCATPQELYEMPRTRYVADFIGETNFLNGRLTNLNGYSYVMVDDKLPILATATRDPISYGDPVTVAIRPEKVNVFSMHQPYKDERGFSTNADEIEHQLKAEHNNVVVRGVVQDAIYIGTDTRYVVRLTDSSQVIARVQNEGPGYDQQIRRGEEVLVHWAAENARILND